MKERWPEMLEYQQKVQAMTDLERAYALVHSDPEHIEAALAAARREGYEEAAKERRAGKWYETGAEEMRERAAQAAESDDWSDVYGWNPVALSIAKTIRALPLTPEEPT